ncbi:Rne/Rng family ribonuclease [Niallia sp. 01092]|uniref:Rne/Rng family ribonuclease n=1 Tax=unclassified Niallia TaxID=2837522 RepID=UPI003FD29D91
MDKVLINVKTTEKRFVYIKENRLERLYVQQPQQVSSVGNIYLGQVTKVVPGMNAAFVEIGEGKGGYLSKEKIASYACDNRNIEQKKNISISSFVKQGERVLVQVVKDASGTKGPKLTGILEFSGENIVYMPFGRYTAVSKKIGDAEKTRFLRGLGNEMTTENEGIIFRTSAANLTKEQLTLELDHLREQFQEVANKAAMLKKVTVLKEKDDFEKELINVLDQLQDAEVMVDDLEDTKKWARKYPNLIVQFYQHNKDMFSYYGIEKEIDKALKRIVWLENGAYIIIDETEALTMIDVNTGKFSGKNRLEDTVFQTNKLAAKEVARQLKIRDISGIVLVDFIDMTAFNQKQIQEEMINALQQDSRQTKVLGFTSLGILQLTRKKTVKALKEVLHTKCTVCDGTGFVLSPESVAFQLERELWEYRYTDCERILIEATADVIQVFSGPKDIHKSRLEEILGIKLEFQSSSMAKPHYSIIYTG